MTAVPPRRRITAAALSVTSICTTHSTRAARERFPLCDTNMCSILSE